MSDDPARIAMRTDLNTLPNDQIETDGASVAGLEEVTAGIEKSLVNLTVDDVLDMPFVKPNGGYLVGSLLQKRRFSAQAMERLMIEKLWNPLYVIQMQEVGKNLFLFGFEHQMDLKKVIREGPWRFNKHFLILKEVSSPTQAVRSILTKIPIWVHIVDVPPSWLTLKAAHAIGIKIGSVLEVDPDSAGVRGLGYLRVRVALEAAAPLPRGLTIAMGDASQLVGFRYERLENYCYRCGFLDHIEDDCLKPYDSEATNVWNKDFSAFPPIKKFPRQMQGRGSARVFGSVSPIEGIGRRGSNVVEMSKEDFPYDLGISTNVYGEDRAKKRSFAATMAPPGFEKAIMVVNDKENNKSEQVGKDAHLGE